MQRASTLVVVVLFGVLSGRSGFAQIYDYQFAAGDPYANCDGSSLHPILNASDFICFNNRFAAGCP